MPQGSWSGVNWTEILARGGVPEPPGREELLARIREEREVASTAVDQTVLPKRKKRKRK